MIAAKETADVTGLAKNYGLCVRVTGIADNNCTGASCASSQVPTAVPFPIAPSNVWLPAGTVKSLSFSSPSTSVSLTLNTNTLSIPYFDPIRIATQIGTLSAPAKVSTAIYTIMAGSGGVSGSNGCGAAFVPAAPFASNTQMVQGAPVAGYVYLPSTVTAKAVWNNTQLNNEQSFGIHNLPWTNAVIGATEAAIQTATTNGTY
jgi:hypothetical protein